MQRMFAAVAFTVVLLLGFAVVQSGDQTDLDKPRPPMIILTH